MAASTASVPELQKKIFSRPAGSLATRALGEESGQDRHVHLHQMRELAVQDVAQDRDQLGVIAAESEHAPAREQVEVAVALAVEQIRAAGAV